MTNLLSLFTAFIEATSTIAYLYEHISTILLSISVSQHVGSILGALFGMYCPKAVCLTTGQEMEGQQFGMSPSI